MLVGCVRAFRTTLCPDKAEWAHGYRAGIDVFHSCDRLALQLSQRSAGKVSKVKGCLLTSVDNTQEDQAA